MEVTFISWRCDNPGCRRRWKTKKRFMPITPPKCSFCGDGYGEEIKEDEEAVEPQK